MTRVGENPPRLPKRFYKDASIEGGALHLDGRPAKTRGGRPLACAHGRLMAAVADEWRSQSETIDFSTMPMTRFATTLIDLGEQDAFVWREALLAFLRSDLLCYRANEPQALVERQNAAWDPLLDWASTRCGIGLVSREGVAFIEQPSEAIMAGERIFAAQSPETLLGMKAAAEIAGSAVIALALARNAFEPSPLFDAARIDETFQAERWGVDAEAAARAAALRRDFMDAARFLSLV